MKTPLGIFLFADLHITVLFYIVVMRWYGVVLCLLLVQVSVIHYFPARFL